MTLGSGKNASGSDPRQGRARTPGSAGGARNTTQVLFVIGVIGGTVGLLLLAGALLSDGGNKTIGWAIVGGLALLLVGRLVYRRRSRKSLHDTIPSRSRES